MNIQPANRPRITKRSWLAWLLVPCLALLAQGASAQLQSSNFSLVPPLITEAAPPNVMLVMSNDQELYKKAYSDFTDINSDGIVDSSYDDSFTYSGYFDANFCYTYDATAGRYEPATDISSLIGSTGHSCAAVSGNWSGNFMNWASMTRMDILRDVLFGGARSTDTATSGATQGVTVLERVFLPEDIHDFVKVFTGSTQKYTPYTYASISLCSITFGAESNAPVIRVAEGAWPLWSSSEVVQCHYTNEQDSGLGNQPTTSNRPSPYSFNARVHVCVVSLDASGSRCKAYSNTATGDITYKPIGLLQKYGDSSTINFGLITGSYNKKIDGGVLRKNIVPLTGNSTASLNEINLNNGIFLNQGSTDAGIINTISRFKIVNWDYTNNNYSDCDTYGISTNDFKTSTASNRQCRNWGNPLSEIYLEALRYFTGSEVSGATAGHGLPTAAFNTSDSSQIASLPQLSWTDPLSSANACASCSIIVLSTGLNSFDKDGLSSATDLWNVAGTSRLTATTRDKLTDDVGDIEGISGGSYLVGNNGSTNDNACTAKTITDLSDAKGICPEIGSLEGGYDMAGLAYHAYTKDMRNALTGIQKVSTYSVSLASNLPSYQLNVNGKTVTFAPICSSNTDSNSKLDQSGWTACTFGNAKIESQDSHGGRMYVAWEDSMWGNDYDMDAISRIEWCIGTNTALCPGEANNANYGSGWAYSDFAWKTGQSANTIQFRTSGVLAAAGDAIKVGISISGVTNAGTVTKKINTEVTAVSASPTTANSKNIVHATQGNGEQYFLLIPGNYTISRLVQNSGNRYLYHEPLVYTADSNVTAGKVLPNPLYFTAKYGSFNDIDGDGTPLYNSSSSDTREWDTHDVNGNETPDGIPDNYFPITNPSQLSSSLSQVFEIITSRISSGTAAAVVANSSTGLGSVYQAYYHPLYTDSNNVSITWGGVLHSMFIDASGRFREDKGTPGTLDGTDTDYVVDIFFDKTVSPNRTRFQRYTQTGSGPTAVLTKTGTADDLENFGSIWNARDMLANISQADLLTQRTVDVSTNKFNDDAANKRYIFTYLDSISSGTRGVVDSGEVIDFSSSNFDPANGTNNFRYLGLSNSANSQNLIKYIRGQDQSGWRSRLVDIPGDGTSTPKYWILGDIVHSSPLVVNPPLERYDLINGDETYQAFKEQYEHRRQMIYTGANDGMLHAFNGGIWDAPSQTFETQGYNTATGAYDAGQNHALGAEMWAYVPMNLLPHLQWLTETNYPHVYYVDAPPQSYDVNIFADDTTHPGGWGTILVVGMRLGGGHFPVDLDGDATKETVMSSAYIIMDITDPEQPPTLIAELSASDLGFTTSMPALIKSRQSNSLGGFGTPDSNQWLLVFGSGPDTLTTAVSNAQDAKLFAYNLVSRSMVTINSAAQTPVANPSGYFGDIKPVDWEKDYSTDVLYLGTVEGTESAPTGRMKRIVLDPTATNMGLSTGAAVMSDMLNMGQPVSAAVTTQVAVAKGEKWVMFGTGRLFTTVDNRSSTQQSFYGIKEASNYNTSTLTTAKLVDSTAIIVKTTGNIYNGTVGTTVTRNTTGGVATNLPTFSDLYRFMDNHNGWVRKFTYSSGSNPSERVFNTSLVLGSTIVFSTYTPSTDLCTVEGDGALYALNFRTGTAETFSPFGEDPDNPGFSAPVLDLGQGAPSAPTAVVRTGDDAGVNASNVGDMSVVSGSTTGVTNSTGFASAPAENGRMSWEQLEIPF